MKKCKKIIELIYKKADGIITEKENEILESHINLCESCMEEYKLILTVKEELKNSEYAPLPENFKATLHDKLVNRNLSEPSKIPFYKKIPVNIIATACLAIGITIFALNTNVDKINSHTGTELINTSGENNNLQDENSKARSIEQPDNQQLYTEDKPLNNMRIIPKKANSTSKVENSNTPIVSEVQTVEIMPEANNEDLSAFSDEESVYSQGGGGGSSAPVTRNYIIIKVNSFENILNLIPYSEKDGNNYYISMDKFEEIKEILKDYITSIENETEETKNAEKFIIELK